MIEPDICSSLCCGHVSSHCKECSHAFYRGQGKDKNGKIRYWEFNFHFGPMFTNKTGKILKRQPIEENDICLTPFEKWYKNFIKAQHD